MSTRRYVYDKVHDKIVEVFGERQRQSHNILPDLDRVYNGGFRSPIDGEMITSRSQLRAHERKHGVRQAGDFKRGELIASEKKRVAASMPSPRDGVSFKWI